MATYRRWRYYNGTICNPAGTLDGTPMSDNALMATCVACLEHAATLLAPIAPDEPEWPTYREAVEAILLGLLPDVQAYIAARKQHRFHRGNPAMYSRLLDLERALRPDPDGQRYLPLTGVTCALDLTVNSAMGAIASHCRPRRFGEVAGCGAHAIVTLHRHELISPELRTKLVTLAKIRDEHFDEYVTCLAAGQYPSEAATVIALRHDLPLPQPDRATRWLWMPEHGTPHA